MATGGFFIMSAQSLPGIGHRVKSVNNPDKRVELIKTFVKNHFVKTPLLDFALDVEKVAFYKSFYAIKY
jgi:citrate synthase